MKKNSHIFPPRRRIFRLNCKGVNGRRSGQICWQNLSTSLALAATWPKNPLKKADKLHEEIIVVVMRNTGCYGKIPNKGNRFWVSSSLTHSISMQEWRRRSLKALAKNVASFWRFWRRGNSFSATLNFELCNEKGLRHLLLQIFHECLWKVEKPQILKV